MPPLEHNDAATDDYKDGNFNDVKVFNFRMEEGRLSLSKPPKFPIFGSFSKIKERQRVQQRTFNNLAPLILEYLECFKSF